LKLRTGPPTPSATQLKRRLAAPGGDDGQPGKTRAGRHWLSRIVSISVAARSLILVAVVVAAAVFVWREVDDSSIHVEPISVPVALAERGLTSSVATAQVVDRIGEIVREMGSPESAPQLRVASEVPEFRIVTFGPSLQAIGREIRRATGHPDTSIAGAITLDGTGMHVTMRKPAARLATTLDTPDDSKWQTRAVDAAAIGVLRLTEPELLMNYQYTQYNRTIDPAALAELEKTVEFYERSMGGRGDRHVRHFRALLSLEQGDFANAELLWRQLGREYPDWTLYNSFAAAAAVAAGRVDEANALLTTIVHSDIPEPRPGMLAHTAAMLAMTGRNGDALTVCIRSLRTGASAKSRYMAAYALRQLHRPAEAVAVLENWVPPHTEDFVHAQGFLADAYADLGDAAHVSEIRKRLQRDFPNDITTQKIVAADAETRGDLVAALAAYAAIHGDLTSDLGAQFGQGRVLVKMGRPKEALPFLERHLQREPLSIEGHYWRARALANAGQGAAALAAYAALIARDPDNVAALNEWADALDRAGRPDEGIAKRALATAAQRRLAIPVNLPTLPRT
jgi:tetratricopeptide (TPR) repeat protein